MNTIELNDFGILNELHSYRSVHNSLRKAIELLTEQQSTVNKLEVSLEEIKQRLGAQATLKKTELVIVDTDGIAFIVPVPPTGYAVPPFNIRAVKSIQFSK